LYTIKTTKIIDILDSLCTLFSN